MSRISTDTGMAVPPPIPALPTIGFLRQPQVLRLIPISKSTLWRHVQAKTFPQPVKLSQRVTAWRAEDIRRWIEQQAVVQ
jgi:prophage regulatory protein